MRNWPKYLLQWGVLASLVGFISGVFPSLYKADPEAYCPMGGLQALATYLANDSLPCSMTSMQVMMGVIMVAAVVLFSKLFCAYICPLGTVQDLIGKIRVKVRLKSIKIENGSIIDKLLRVIKYGILFWVFYMTVGASELFCKNIDPYYAVATGFKGELTLWMSIVSVCVLVLGSLAIDMFWCRYLCPLGAISNSFKFWVWIIVLFAAYFVSDVIGADIPWPAMLGAFCVLGYCLEIFKVKPSLQILHVTKDEVSCNNCGLCEKKCPYHIPLRSFRNGSVNHVDCTLCGECVATCPAGSLNVGFSKPSKGRAWKLVPPVLTVALVIFGIWVGGKIELPTIDMKWGLENVDTKDLETVEFDGLKSLKCFGSAMTFKVKLQDIPGVHGVKVFVKRHAAEILYDATVTDPDKLLQDIYVPSVFRIRTIDPAAVPVMKCVTIRTEGMYDRYDINYLGHQMYRTGKKVYALETEFACPLIVRVYMDPSENLTEEWFEEVVEKEEVTVPAAGGGARTVTLDYDFVCLEEGESIVNTDLIYSPR